MVAFNNIPGNIRVPLAYAEFRPGGTPYQSQARLLLPGQKLATGDAVANIPVQINDGQEEMLFGAGSMLSQMFRTARKQAPLQEIWGLPLDDLGGGVKATGSITITGAPITQAAVLSIYIAGIRIRVGILTTDTNANIATNLAAAINADINLPVTAAVDGVNTNEVDITARHKGTLGNAILIDTGELSVDGPPPVTVAIVAMAGGSGDPDLATAFGNLGDDEFDWIASPYSDTTNLGRASDLLNDISGRWSYVSQLYGHYLATHTGTVSALSTLGNGRNNQHESIFPCRNFLSPPWELAAAVGAVMALHLQDAPELSRPLQSLKLQGIKPPRSRADWLTKANRQTLYFDGISGYYVQFGEVYIDRILTTYQANAWGDVDWTYLDVETMAQSMFGWRSWRAKITSTHGRQALADDNPAGLAHIVTPADIRQTTLHWYAEMVAEGVFENFDAFEAALVVERDSTDPNRVNVEANVDHTNQLRIFAAAIVNHMQLQRAA